MLVRTCKNVNDNKCQPRKEIAVAYLQTINVTSTHRRQKLTVLYLFTDLFHKEIFPHSSE